MFILTLMMSLSAHATSALEPVYGALKQKEDAWQACYKYVNPEFQRCIEGVATEAETWNQTKFAEVRTLVGKRIDPVPKLEAFNRMHRHYKSFLDNQCEYEAYTRSDQFEEQQLQRTRCRFRRAFDSIIHIYAALNLFGEGRQEYDDSFLKSHKPKPTEESKMEIRIKEIVSKHAPCFKAAQAKDDIAELNECIASRAEEMQDYRDRLYAALLPILPNYPRGNVRQPILKATESRYRLWTTDVCTFVGEYYKGDRNPHFIAAKRNSCVYQYSLARIRETFQLR